MRYGFYLPTRGPTATRDGILALAREGESISTRHLSRELLETVRDHSLPLLAPNEGAEPGDKARQRSVAADGQASGKVRPLGVALASYEAKYLADALALHSGNVSRTAVALGISRVTLQKKMKEYLLR